MLRPCFLLFSLQRPRAIGVNFPAANGKPEKRAAKFPFYRRLSDIGLRRYSPTALAGQVGSPPGRKPPPPDRPFPQRPSPCVRSGGPSRFLAPGAFPPRAKSGLPPRRSSSGRPNRAGRRFPLPSARPRRPLQNRRGGSGAAGPACAPLSPSGSRAAARSHPSCSRNSGAPGRGRSPSQRASRQTLQRRSSSSCCARWSMARSPLRSGWGGGSRSSIRQKSAGPVGVFWR